MEINITRELSEPLIYDGEVLATISATFNASVAYIENPQTLLEAKMNVLLAEDNCRACEETLESAKKSDLPGDIATTSDIVAHAKQKRDEEQEFLKHLSEKSPQFLSRPQAEKVFLCAVDESLAKKAAEDYLVNIYY